MMKYVKRICAILLISLMLTTIFTIRTNADDQGISVDSPSALLMDLKSGKILY